MRIESNFFWRESCNCKIYIYIYTTLTDCILLKRLKDYLYVKLLLTGFVRVYTISTIQIQR